ncbi:transposase [Thermospira aquatica]|uniref:Mutator family transposase n=1 Tax=Thermospira aquatica TaxID=2828656 RepID=A0AAX3BBY1_9SPIR|nr:transposase [Thermospira aquatica]URA09758.1 transposase [Thermospira aquatica]
MVFLDAMVFPIKRDRVENESIYVAIGITPEGRRKILGYYLPGGMESAYNWREILDIRERGVKQIHFIVSDGLSGMKNVITEIYPTQSISPV